MPFAPGNVPKYESNDRFSCMMTTTCWILWMPAAAALLLTDGEADDKALPELDNVAEGDAELSDEHAMTISAAAAMIAKSPARTLRISPNSPEPSYLDGPHSRRLDADDHHCGGCHRPRSIIPAEICLRVVGRSSPTSRYCRAACESQPRPQHLYPARLLILWLPRA